MQGKTTHCFTQFHLFPNKDDRIAQSVRWLGYYWMGKRRNFLRLRAETRKPLLQNAHTRSAVYAPFCSNRYGTSFPRSEAAQGVKLATRFHIIPQLRIHGSRSPFSHKPSGYSAVLITRATLRVPWYQFWCQA